MDPGYLIDVASLCLRWVHVIVAIAWIGSSFYFTWLDNSLKPPTDEKLKEKGVAGELWALHGGGFYNPQKYLVAPKELPEDLHWFFWPSYSTFLTGFLLVSTLYYLQASTYMVDPMKAAISPLTSVGIGIGTLILGWLVYDTLARIFINRSQMVFAILYTLFVTAVSYTLCRVLSGRAAYLHVGAMIATSMTANVFFIIIPAQTIVVGAMSRGEIPDSKPGKRAKQRSYHNNYLTLPVLFCMISNHYAFTYNHPQAWLVLILILIGSAIIRHFFNLRHKGQSRWEYLIIGGAILLAVFCSIMPKPIPVGSSSAVPTWTGPTPTFADITPIIAHRCLPCHAEHPSLVPAPPAGVMLDSYARLKANKDRIYTQAIRLKAMPFANKTNMSETERSQLAAWLTRGDLH